MNWDYPDEITPLKDQFRVVGIGFLCGLIFRCVFFPLCSALSEPGVNIAAEWYWLLAIGFPCFLTGFVGGICFYKSLGLPFAALKMSAWAAIFALSLFAVPVLELVVIALIAIFTGLPLLGILVMSIGTSLGLAVRRALDKRQAANPDQ